MKQNPPEHSKEKGFHFEIIWKILGLFCKEERGNFLIFQASFGKDKITFIVKQNTPELKQREERIPLDNAWKILVYLLALPMLKATLSPKAEGHQVFLKPSKPCHVGINWIAPPEYSQMSTHVQGFQSFNIFVFIASFSNCKIGHQQHKESISQLHSV